MGEQIVESTISSVTVFRSGAVVTRMASLPELKENRLRMVGLPLSLDDGTVRCRIVSSEGSEAEADRNAPVAADFKVALHAPGLLESELRPEAKELKELRLEIKQLRARARILREGLAYQVALGNRATNEKGKTPIESPLEARLALLEFSDKYHHSLYDEHHAAQEKIETAQRRLEELEVAEQRASSVGQADREDLNKCVVVEVQGSLGKDDEVELQYFVPGARWAPAYGLRIREDLTAAELTMRAMVSQRSGEDWNGVKVTLSTAELQRWAELPELKSKRIGRRQPPAPKRGWRPPPAGSEELYRDYDNSFGVHATPLIGAGSAVPEPVLFGGSGSVVTASYPVAADEGEADFSSFDDEEHTSELLESDLAAPPPAMAPQASRAAAPATRRESRKRAPSKMKKSRDMAKEELWEDKLALGGGGGYLDSPIPAPEPESGINDALLNYANLRMAAAGSMERGSLQLSTSTSIYLEYLVEQGMKEDDERCQRMLLQTAVARENAMDIATVPTNHTLAWADDYDYAYQAQSSLDLASDGQFHNLPVMVGDASCSAKHVVVPRESTDVFRTLQMSNCFSAPLLPGPMDVYWNENFLLTSQLAFTAPSGEVELGLGVDQAIKVVRNTSYREDTTGLMGGSLQLTHKIAIEVANKSERPIDLHVHERVPVASSDADDIKVTIKSVVPDWERYEPEPENAHIDALQGGYEWQMVMPPGERTELSASYEIRLPSKFELRGGNRREW